MRVLFSPEGSGQKPWKTGQVPLLDTGTKRETGPKTLSPPCGVPYRSIVYLVNRVTAERLAYQKERGGQRTLEGANCTLPCR